MSLNQYTQKIDRYLSKNEGLPIVVDVQNEADQIELVQHYHVGKNELITASKYCASDEMPRYEELLNDLYLGKLAVACTVFPNLNDKELQDSYKVMGADALLKTMLTPGEYAEYLTKIQEVCGFDTTMQDEVDEAKN